MANHVRKDVENRLETTYHIRANFQETTDERRYCILGKLPSQKVETIMYLN